ncbi:MAG: hypothetical protein P1P64_04860 [Treponemataceae bacterium]
MKKIFQVLGVALLATFMIGCPQGNGNNSSTEASFMLTFDSTKMKISYFDESSTRKTVNSGDKVKEGTRLKILTNTEREKIISEWTLNGIKTEEVYSEKTSGLYTINSQDAVDKAGTKKIDIDFTVVDAEKFIVEFPADKMSCSYNLYDYSAKSFHPYTRTTLKSGDPIYEGEDMKVLATLAEGKFVDAWSINDKPITNYNIVSEDQKSLTVFAVDSTLSNAENKIIFNYTERDALKFTVKFDKNKIKCEKKTGTGFNFNYEEIEPGSEVMELQSLRFTALSGNDNTQWFVNGAERWSLFNSELYLTPKASDAVDGVITVTIK